jgi:putative tricarboxylic transport membrane protein
MNRKDLLAAAILLLIAGAYFWAAQQIPSSTLDDGVGPRGFPLVLTIALVAVAAAIALRALAPAVGTRAHDDAKETEARWPRALGLLAFGALYIPVATVLGYALAVFVLLAAMLLYEGVRFSWRVPAVAAGGAAVFYLLFVVVLGVRQPEGLLF